MDKTILIDFWDVLAAIDNEMLRVGWSKTDGIAYIENKYGCKSRFTLKDDELLEFLRFLKAIPSNKDSRNKLIASMKNETNKNSSK